MGFDASGEVAHSSPEKSMLFHQMIELWVIKYWALKKYIKRNIHMDESFSII